MARLASLRASSPTLTATPSSIDAFHRQHASVELAIRDLKEGAGLEHIPSGDFYANGAWLQCAVLAHNLIRWTATIGQPHPSTSSPWPAPSALRLITIPARLVNRSGTLTLRGPARWPWAQLFTRRLATIRALPSPRLTARRTAPRTQPPALTTEKPPGLLTSRAPRPGHPSATISDHQSPPDTATPRLNRWIEAKRATRFKASFPREHSGPQASRPNPFHRPLAHPVQGSGGHARRYDVVGEEIVHEALVLHCSQLRCNTTQGG